LVDPTEVAFNAANVACLFFFSPDEDPEDPEEYPEVLRRRVPPSFETAEKSIRLWWEMLGESIARFCRVVGPSSALSALENFRKKATYVQKSAPPRRTSR
jgi:hypothetical protein